MLLKRPGLTFVAVITLTLGIGANTAIFSVVQSVLLRPFPFDEEGLIVAWKEDETTDHSLIEISIPEFNDWQSQSQVFEHLAAMTTSVYGFGYTLIGQGEPVRIQSARVSATFFPALGVARCLDAPSPPKKTVRVQRASPSSAIDFGRLDSMPIQI